MRDAISRPQKLIRAAMIVTSFIGARATAIRNNERGARAPRKSAGPGQTGGRRGGVFICELMRCYVWIRGSAGKKRAVFTQYSIASDSYKVNSDLSTPRVKPTKIDYAIKNRDHLSFNRGTIAIQCLNVSNDLKIGNLCSLRSYISDSCPALFAYLLSNALRSLVRTHFTKYAFWAQFQTQSNSG